MIVSLFVFVSLSLIHNFCGKFRREFNVELESNIKNGNNGIFGLGLLLIGISKFLRMKQHNFWVIGRVLWVGVG